VLKTSSSVKIPVVVSRQHSTFVMVMISVVTAVMNQPTAVSDISFYLTVPLYTNLEIIPLFSPLGKLADRAIYFACVNFFLFLNRAKVSQDLLDRFLQFFTKWKVFVLTLSIGTSFFRFLKER